MKAPKWKTCTAEQMWKYVGWHLSYNNIETVLVGGAVVSIYTEGAYQSGDLDFVVITYLHDHLPKVLAKIGFKKKGKYFFNSKCKHLYIEFVSAPLGIGDDTSVKPDEISIEGKIVRILSPTDCIRDRLASYIHFNVRECMDQAVLVAKSHPFNLSKISKWCLNEGGEEALGEFKRLIKK
jgi:hypothetical protein